MNPELTERPHEIAYYKEQREMERQERISWGVLILLLTIGAVTGCLLREIYEWIF